MHQKGSTASVGTRALKIALSKDVKSFNKPQRDSAINRFPGLQRIRFKGDHADVTVKKDQESARRGAADNAH